MAIEQEYVSDQGAGIEKVKGSDGRANSSARTDSRGYYNSRDAGNAFSVPFDFQSAIAGEFAGYLQNNHPQSLQLVVSGIGVNTVTASKIKLHFVTGTAANGNPVTPTNLNATSSNKASLSGTVTAMEGATNGTGVDGLTSAGVIDFLYVQATGHEEFRLDDRLRLGVEDAIAIEFDEGTSGDISGVIFFYYEKKGLA